jgi:hypothetical protein
MTQSFSPHPPIVVEYDNKFWACNIPHSITLHPTNGPTCGGFINIPYETQADAQHVVDQSRRSTQHIFNVWNDNGIDDNTATSVRDRNLVSSY